MRLDISKLEEIGGLVLDVASSFSPTGALIVRANQLKQLLEAGSELNGLLARIRNQSDADSLQVWEAVEADYSDAVDAFRASLKAHG
jgi:predicted component of type VI protein secretion system